MRQWTRRAIRLRRRLRRAGIARPFYWQHGHDSVVYSWESGTKELLITISDSHVSALLTRAGVIIHRELLQ